MPDREKVIKGLEMSYKYSNVDENNTLVPQWIVLHALSLLKAQEPRVMAGAELTDAELIDEIRKAPIVLKPNVDAVPVVHARWINYPECLGYDGAYTDEHIVCSACHSVWNIIDNDADRFDHCPACGAKMDGERRDEDAAD